MAKAKPITGIHCKAPLLVSSRHIIEIRLSEMLDYESYVANQEAVYELHQMRIAAKRLRYTLEIFQDAYDAFSGIGPQIKAATKEVEQIQENLGAIHDADVLVPQLNQYLARLLKEGYGTDRWGAPAIGVYGVDYNGCLGLITVCQRLRSEREQLYDRFLDHWQKLQAENFFENLREQLRDAAEGMSAGDFQADSQADQTTSSVDLNGMDRVPVETPSRPHARH